MKCLALALLLGCGGVELAPTNLTGCESICAIAVKLDCPGSEGSPGADDIYGTADDVSCAQACGELQGAGEGFVLPDACIRRATSCEAMDECFVGEVEK